MKAKCLVADTSAFFKYVPLWEYADVVYTIPEVLREIRDKRTRQHVESLPIQLEFRQPKPESVKIINDITKKTGEYNVLSLTDVKVMALTYELDVEAHKGSTDHLCFKPQQINCEIGPPKRQEEDANLVGFYTPSEHSGGNVNSISAVSSEENDTVNETGSESDPEQSLSLHSNVGQVSSQDILWKHMIGLEMFLADNSYIRGYLPTAEDLMLYNTLAKDYPEHYPRKTKISAEQTSSEQIDSSLQSLFPHIWRWSSHIASFSDEERDSFPPSEQSLAAILHDFGERARDMEKGGGNESSTNIPPEIGSLSLAENKESHEENGESDKENGEMGKDGGDDEEEEDKGEGVEEFNYEDLDDEEKACIDALAEEDFTGVDENEEEDTEFDKEEENEEFDDDEENEEIDEDDDDEGWITPSNFKKSRVKRYTIVTKEEEVEEDEVEVACMSTDFAIQNTLKHIGLHIMGIDGMLIKQVRTFIQRCFSCFKITSRATKLFCPKCGNKTLKKVSVTLNADGSKKIWINSKKPMSKRGMKYSLPKPRGGKNARYPLLYADQKQNRNCPSNLSKKKVNPLDVDYVVMSAPFARRDVFSKASQLGNIAGKKNHNLYWERKNPNVTMKKTRKKK